MGGDFGFSLFVNLTFRLFVRPTNRQRKCMAKSLRLKRKTTDMMLDARRLRNSYLFGKRRCKLTSTANKSIRQEDGSGATRGGLTVGT